MIFCKINLFINKLCIQENGKTVFSSSTTITPKNKPVNCQDELKQNNIDVLSLSLSNKFSLSWKSRLRARKKNHLPTIRHENNAWC